MKTKETRGISLIVLVITIVYKIAYSNRETTVTGRGTYTTILTLINSLAYKIPETIQIYMGEKAMTNRYTYNYVSGKIKITNITGNIVIIKTWVKFGQALKLSQLFF